MLVFSDDSGRFSLCDRKWVPSGELGDMNRAEPEEEESSGHGQDSLCPHVSTYML